MNLFFILPIILLFSSFLGIIFGRKNLILILISLEIMLLSLVFHYLLIGWCNFGDSKVILLAICLLTIGAAESALMLGLIISYYKIENYY